MTDKQKEELNRLQKNRPAVLSDDEVDSVAGGGGHYDAVIGYQLNQTCGNCQRDCWTYNSGDAVSEMYHYSCAVCRNTYTTTPNPPSCYELISIRIEV
jgi:hypothetical protein